MLKDEIKNIASKICRDVITNRRYLHLHPELSFCEFGTSAYIKSKLDQIGIAWTSMSETGVIGIIQGEKPSDAVIALRADMDALPITELNNIAYASQNNGIMHACGHDAHTASLLGTARILYSLKNKFSGTIKLVFQPGEEKLPGGASLMINDGVLTNPEPNAIIAQHVSPELECGKIGIRKGKFMASMDEIFVTVYGKGGHGAQPHKNIDPVLITSHIISALQQIVSRMANPTIPTVLSFGKLTANGAINVIPNEVHIEGTFRTLDESWRAEAHQRMKNMAETIAESMGGRCDFTINHGYPFLTNDELLSENVMRFAEEYVGKNNVVETDIWMAAEDFAYYSQMIDACFYLLGTRNSVKGITSSLHTPTFDIDEEALSLSTGLMAYVALRHLGN